MYGNLLPQSAEGQVGAGLGMTTSSGTVTLIAPTDLIKEKWETHTVGGMEMEFMLTPGSEAPAEMHWYMPALKTVSTAENATHNFHNLYTPRGAKTRDARLWPMYMNQTIQRWGDKYEVQISMHHWPVWGRDKVSNHLKHQRDVIKYTHDRVLHLANLGYTIDEIGNMIEIPQSILQHWGTHPYYGGVQRNARSVYNFYLGYFDGNPATIVKLAPADRARAYADAFGVDALISAAKKHADKGDYRTASEFGNMAVFADPKNEQARMLQAGILEQLGYQAESGPNRNFFLAGAEELRKGVKVLPAPNTASIDILENMTLDMVFDFMGISLDSDAAVGKTAIIQWNFSDTSERYTLFLENSVLNYWPDSSYGTPDTTVTLTRDSLNKVFAKQASFEALAKSGEVDIKGDAGKLKAVLSLQTNFSKSFWFNIVTP
jgi:alkyl sulfatase BDS1-like metallo-beta-lactamase superfamily hydrolase